MVCLLRRSKVRSEVLESREGAGKKYCKVGWGRDMLIKQMRSPDMTVCVYVSVCTCVYRM